MPFMHVVLQTRWSTFIVLFFYHPTSMLVRSVYCPPRVYTPPHFFLGSPFFDFVSYMNMILKHLPQPCTGQREYPLDINIDIIVIQTLCSFFLLSFHPIHILLQAIAHLLDNIIIHSRIHGDHASWARFIIHRTIYFKAIDWTKER